MVMRLRSLVYLVIAFQINVINAQVIVKDTLYTYKEGDPNGIGKWYMDREISLVMGHVGIDWLNRPEREKEENTAKLIRNMKINADDRIADIGAGSGFHVFRMAPLADSGLIYAVDIQDEMLAEISLRIDTGMFKNVVPIKGTETSVNLPENSIDSGVNKTVHQ